MAELKIRKSSISEYTGKGRREQAGRIAQAQDIEPRMYGSSY